MIKLFVKFIKFYFDIINLKKEDVEQGKRFLFGDLTHSAKAEEIKFF